ncbi:hypothetical protein BDF22DRAFT_664893 [Syncephalis plumigaleata]|nr:hypothetical protein BDF22DRAFT_664893 [Syncephalis plumigaleata]
MMSPPPPPPQSCDTMPEYPFTHSAPPTFSGPIAPPPALSDYAFTAVSAASPMGAPLVQNGLGDHRNSLMSMMEAAGHFSMSPDFSSISQQPTHGYQQLVNHPGPLTFHYHNLNDTPVSAPVPCPTDPMAHILVNPQDSSNYKSESPTIQHYQPSSLPRPLAMSGSASFSELVQADNSFDNASNWLPLLEGKLATSDSDDSDAVSVRSLGSAVSAHSFDHPIFSHHNLPSPVMYGKCDPAYSPLAHVNFPIMSGSARKMANMLHPITTTVTAPAALPSVSNINNNNNCNNVNFNSNNYNSSINDNAATTFTSTDFNPVIAQL